MADTACTEGCNYEPLQLRKHDIATISSKSVPCRSWDVRMTDKEPLAKSSLAGRSLTTSKIANLGGKLPVICRRA